MFCCSAYRAAFRRRRGGRLCVFVHVLRFRGPAWVTAAATWAWTLASTASLNPAVDFGLGQLCRLCRIVHFCALCTVCTRIAAESMAAETKPEPGGGGPETGEPAADRRGLEDFVRNEANPLGHFFVAQGEEGGLGQAQGLEFGGAGRAGLQVDANFAALGGRSVLRTDNRVNRNGEQLMKRSDARLGPAPF